MNKKISRLLEPNLKLYFLILLGFSLAAFPFKPVLAVVEGAITAALYAYFTYNAQKRRQGILKYIDSVTGSVDTASKSTLINSPLPIMVFRPDTSEIIWCNENFLQLAGVREHVFDVKVEDAVEGFSGDWLLSGKQECPHRVEMNSRRFRVYGSLVRTSGDNDQKLVATTYWVDTTESDDIQEKYDNTRPVVSVLMVDNYDDIMKVCEDTQRSAVLAQIDEKLNQWADGAGMLIKTDRDHYLFVLEEAMYQRLVEGKFSVLDAMRDITVGDGLHPTLSIGVGRDEPDVRTLYKNASLSLEMALSRGGDQAVVRNRLEFSFYGGKSKSTQKRTKVKSRVMSNALSELIMDAKQIYIMGHSYADMDAVGAAVGLCCAARKRQKPAQIIIDKTHNASRQVLEKLSGLPEYADTFISGDDAFLQMKTGDLLIVVDTNRPDMVEEPRVLESSTRVAVIDHHRRASSYIENAALNFHEPYASSAAELVTELLQYMVDPSDLLHEEAEALLAGIVLDTKHFTMRTGSRTFEAAAFLRRAGAEPADVQYLFQSDLTEMVSRYDIICRAEVYRDELAIAAVTSEGVDRVTAAQAADELLTLKGITASFVLYSLKDGVSMSARSMGEVNVQVILESLGGGGNSTTAGGFIEGGDVTTARNQLIAAIEDYLS